MEKADPRFKMEELRAKTRNVSKEDADRMSPLDIPYIWIESKEWKRLP